MQIGQFTLAKDGGWTGSIRTLTIDAKVRLVPNDDRNGDNAPAFRVLVGNARIGDAWDARTAGDNPRYYLRVRLDDPSLAEPLSAALFPSDEGDRAQLVWNRRRDQ
ncbi:MAG: hypothetical protein BroJett030_33590 [Alphaproteobacteria bacterium]|nr:MAG: hypothetical protein BroJett030_33590 [Alphaproteobacteria bacterium]